MNDNNEIIKSSGDYTCMLVIKTITVPKIEVDPSGRKADQRNKQVILKLLIIW